MSSSKTSQSSLKSVQRTFSTTSGAAEPKSSQEIYLTPGHSSGNQPLVDSKSVNKRPSDPSSLSGIHATKKPRRLPSGYKDDDTNGGSSNTSRFFPPGNNAARMNVQVKRPIAAHTFTKGTVASVFLSQEQSQIKSLAEMGKSLFYTGSAG